MSLAVTIAIVTFCSIYNNDKKLLYVYWPIQPASFNFHTSENIWNGPKIFLEDEKNLHFMYQGRVVQSWVKITQGEF